MALSKKDILASDDLPREKVAVPEWATHLPSDERFVYVRTVTAAEREAWENQADVGGAYRSRNHLRAGLVALAVCDEQGNALFSEEDISGLARKGSPAMMRLYDVAQRLSRVSPADVADMEKNSDASPSDSSASGSPPTSR